MIDDGEFMVFVGPSGCGETTLLRMIAGLEEISSGSIAIGGVEVNEIAPAKRGVATVFQSYALYPHMTVRNNMAFGPKQAKTPKAEIDQRVAIGRAIVRDPEVFLFDEPLSNLDAPSRSCRPGSRSRACMSGWALRWCM